MGESESGGSGGCSGAWVPENEDIFVREMWCEDWSRATIADCTVLDSVPLGTLFYG